MDSLTGMCFCKDVTLAMLENLKFAISLHDLGCEKPPWVAHSHPVIRNNCTVERNDAERGMI